MKREGFLLLYIIGFLVLVQFLLFSCATPMAPEGGPRDEQAPQLDSIESTPNFQTNFTKQRIELTFDEWVKLDDPFNQIVYSPPLQPLPIVSIKGKTVRVDFEEESELRDSATYTINFGESIVDLTEGNPAENLRFVFSTGNFLDSLEISGIVVDALTAEPVEEVRFMLYENLADSVVRTELPFYFNQTGKDGRFRIQNIKKGTFKGFALLNDFGYYFDQPNEQIGFPDDFIVINDTTTNFLEIRLFQEEKTLQILDEEDDNYGVLKVIFNRIPYDVDLIYELTDQTVFYEYDRDTLKVWYDQESDSTWQFIVRQDTLINDTIEVKAVDRTSFIESAQLKPFKPLRDRRQTIPPNQRILLDFNHPLQQFDTSLMRLYEDTSKVLVQAAFSVDSLRIRQLNMDFKWKEGKVYALEILPGALTDMYGITNGDTLVQEYKIDLIKNFGTIDLTIDSLSADTAYLIELIKGESTVIDTIRSIGQSRIQKTYELLDPGKYIVQIITDYNANGRWDTGRYDLKRQPEPIFRRKLEELRANWEVEALISLEK